VDKSPDAFRTISEVADDLETPAHVLRFWESRFPQIRPVKRAGGRRYYRPADVALLTGIKRLLHDEGLTIRGVQKILREQGVRHVAGLSGEPVPDDIDMDAEAALEAALALNFGQMDDEDIAPEMAESATIHALETALRRSDPRPLETAAEVVSLRNDADVARVEPTEPTINFSFADLVAESNQISSVKPNTTVSNIEAPAYFQPATVMLEPATPAVEATTSKPVEITPQDEAPFIDAYDAASAEIIALVPAPSDAFEPEPQPAPMTITLPSEPTAIAASANPVRYQTIVERLQALPLDAFANRQPEVHALRARLVALRRRVRRAPEISLS
jgi:resuscitation-promoting factor RpfA